MLRGSWYWEIYRLDLAYVWLQERSCSLPLLLVAARLSSSTDPSPDNLPRVGRTWKLRSLDSSWWFEIQNHLGLMLFFSYTCLLHLFLQFSFSWSGNGSRGNRPSGYRLVTFLWWSLQTSCESRRIWSCSFC